MEENEIKNKKSKENKSLIISILAVIISVLMLLTSILSITGFSFNKLKGATNKAGDVITGKTLKCYFGGGVADYITAHAKVSSFGENDIYYPDPQYGSVRVVASGPKINPYGSIIEITFNNSNGYSIGEYNSTSRVKTFKAIVLDTGSTPMQNGSVIDLKFKNKFDCFNGAGAVGISYKVLRVGYYNGTTTKATTKATTTVNSGPITLNCPSVMISSSKIKNKYYYCHTNQTGVKLSVQNCNNASGVSNTFTTKTGDLKKYMKCSNTNTTVVVNAEKSGAASVKREIKLTSSFDIGVKAQEIDKILDNSSTNVVTHNLKKSDFGSATYKDLYIKFTFVNPGYQKYFFRWFSYDSNKVGENLHYHTKADNLCKDNSKNDTVDYRPYLRIYKDSVGGSGLIKVYTTQKACEDDNYGTSNTNVLTRKEVVYNITDYVGPTTTTTTTTTTKTTGAYNVPSLETSVSSDAQYLNKTKDGVYEILKSSLSNSVVVPTNFSINSTDKNNASSYYARWFTYVGLDKNGEISFKTLNGNYCYALPNTHKFTPTLTVKKTFIGRYGAYKIYSSQSACKSDSDGRNSKDVIKELGITIKVVDKFSTAENINTTKPANDINLEFDCPSIGRTGKLYKCTTNQKDVDMTVENCNNTYANFFSSTAKDFTKGFKCSDKYKRIKVSASKSNVKLEREIIISNAFAMGVKMQEINKTLANSKTNQYKYILSESDFGSSTSKELDIKFTFVNTNNTSSKYYFRWFTYKTADITGELYANRIGTDMCKQMYSSSDLSYTPSLTVSKNSKGRAGLMKVYSDQNACKNDNNAKTNNSKVILSQSVIYQIGATEPATPSGGSQTTNPNLVEKDEWYLIKNYYNHDARELGGMLGTAAAGKLGTQAKGECLQACYAYAIYLNSNGTKFPSITPGNYLGEKKGPYSSLANLNKAIKGQLDEGYPVLVHVNSSTNQHWVLAVGYRASKANNPESWTQYDIYAVDPLLSDKQYRTTNVELKNGPISNLTFIGFHKDMDLRFTNNILNVYKGS